MNMAYCISGKCGKRDAEVVGCRDKDFRQVMADYGIDNHAPLSPFCLCLNISLNPARQTGSTLLAPLQKWGKNAIPVGG
jgi:hypothetical protein